MDRQFFLMDFDSEGGFMKPVSPEIQRLSVYLAGPLTNSDQVLAAECVAVRRIVRDLLQCYDYNRVSAEIYDPADVTHPGSKDTAEEVYEKDHDRTMSADLVIFHVNAASLGVGIESQIAADATVPRVTLCKCGCPVSRMYTGLFSPAIVAIEYRNLQDLEMQLSSALPMIFQRTLESASRRRPLMAEFRRINLGRFIFKQRIIHKIPIAALADRTDIREFWLRRLERNPEMAMCLSAMQQYRIAECIKSYISLEGDRLLTMKPTEKQLDSASNKSLENLVSFVLTQKRWIADDKIIRVWSDFLEESATAGKLRNAPEGSEVTVEEWARRMAGLEGRMF
jgi:hypothetical protein